MLSCLEARNFLKLIILGTATDEVGKLVQGKSANTIFYPSAPYSSQVKPLNSERSSWLTNLPHYYTLGRFALTTRKASRAFKSVDYAN